MEEEKMPKEDKKWGKWGCIIAAFVVIIVLILVYVASNDYGIRT